MFSGLEILAELNGKDRSKFHKDNLIIHCILQLTVDNNYNSACPSVLYEANNDDKVFPKIHIDQVDRKHIYVRFPKQVRPPPV